MRSLYAHIGVRKFGKISFSKRHVQTPEPDNFRKPLLVHGTSCPADDGIIIVIITMSHSWHQTATMVTNSDKVAWLSLAKKCSEWQDVALKMFVL